MRRIDETQNLKGRNPGRPEDEGGVAIPKRLPGTIFQGWGPKLMAVAFAMLAPAFASRPATANVVAVSSCENHGARLISSPAISTPEDAAAGGEAILRVDLSATGQIQSVSVAQSTGDARLDFAAMRVARESRYAVALVDCKPSPDSFLYSVSFAN